MKYLLTIGIITLMLFGCKTHPDTSALVRINDSLEKEITLTDRQIDKCIDDYTSTKPASDMEHNDTHAIASATSIFCKDLTDYLVSIKDDLKKQNNMEDEKLCYNFMIATGNAAHLRVQCEDTYKKVLGTDTAFAQTWEKDNFGNGTSVINAILTLTKTQYAFKQKELAKIKEILKSVN